MAGNEDHIRRALFNPVSKQRPELRKVSIVGCGKEGAAIAYALCTQNLCSDIALYDFNEERLVALVLDLQVMASFGKSKVYGSTDLVDATRNSKLCIVTADVTPWPGEKKDDLLNRNMDYLINVIPTLAWCSPDSVILIVASPVESLTYLAWILCGKPWRHVIGAGTSLDEARLRYYVGAGMDVHPSSVHASVFGQRGDRQIHDMSGVSVSGIRPAELEEELRDQADTLLTLASTDVRYSEDSIVSNKGSSSWGLAMSVLSICKAILNDTKEVLPVAVCIEGCKHAEGSTTFMSMPCVLCEDGVHAIVKSHLAPRLQQELSRLVPELQQTQNYVDSFLHQSRQASPTRSMTPPSS